jgi:anti-sigma factor RsiW
MSCPDLETLFLRASEGDEEACAHLESCDACRELMEAHESLEHDLFRLSDPFPPAGFVPGVMAAIEAAPPPVRVELKTGLFILFAAVALGVAAVLAGPHVVAAELGSGTASSFLSLRDLVLGVFSGVAAIWQTAALPMLAVVSALLFGSLVGLRRLAGLGMTEVKVS